MEAYHIKLKSEGGKTDDENCPGDSQGGAPQEYLLLRLEISGPRQDANVLIDPTTAILLPHYP